MSKRSDYNKPKGEKQCVVHRLGEAKTELKAHEWTDNKGEDRLCPGQASQAEEGET